MQYLKILEAKDKTEFYIILVLAILSWLFPDPLPFIDEIVLAYLVIVKYKQLSSQ
jgi:hypothetical protein